MILSFKLCFKMSNPLSLKQVMKFINSYQFDEEFAKNVVKTMLSNPSFNFKDLIDLILNSKQVFPKGTIKHKIHELFTMKELEKKLASKAMYHAITNTEFGFDDLSKLIVADMFGNDSKPSKSVEPNKPVGPSRPVESAVKVVARQDMTLKLVSNEEFPLPERDTRTSNSVRASKQAVVQTEPVQAEPVQAKPVQAEPVQEDIVDNDVYWSIFDQSNATKPEAAASAAKQAEPEAEPEVQAEPEPEPEPQEACWNKVASRKKVFNKSLELSMRKSPKQNALVSKTDLKFESQEKLAEYILIQIYETEQRRANNGEISIHEFDGITSRCVIFDVSPPPNTFDTFNRGKFYDISFGKTVIKFPVVFQYSHDGNHIKGWPFENDGTVRWQVGSRFLHRINCKTLAWEHWDSYLDEAGNVEYEQISKQELVDRMNNPELNDQAWKKKMKTAQKIVEQN